MRLRAQRLGYWLMGTDMHRQGWRWTLGVNLMEWGSYYRSTLNVLLGRR